MRKRRSIRIFAAAIAIALSASLMSQSSLAPTVAFGHTVFTPAHGGVVAPVMNVSWQTLMMAAR